MAEERPSRPPDARERETLEEPERDLAAALHEVGNGLTVILGWLESARDAARGGLDGTGGDSRAAALARVLDAVDVATARTRRAHRIARRAIGAESPQPLAAERLGAVVDEAVRGLEPVASKKGVTLARAMSSSLADAPVEDGEHLLQVATNLLLNAIEATPAGGAVELVGEPGGSPSAARLWFVDGGPGVPPEDRTRIFLRGATGRRGGAGIGLAHARDIAAQAGGRLSLAPFEPGRGARFELLWPVVDTEPQSSPRTVRPANLRGVRVVVLEDDDAVVELLGTVLGARGADVQAVRTVAELHRALTTTPAHVVLLDASPLGGALLEPTVRALRAEHPSVGIILISGAADPGADTSRLGITWVRKPFEVHEVVDVVRVIAGPSVTD